MSKNYSHLNSAWAVMDVRNMEVIPSHSIDVVIDRATMDSMVRGSVWDPPDDVNQSIGETVSEVSRVLKPGGLFLYITYRQPHFVRLLLGQSPTLARKFLGIQIETLEQNEGGVSDYFGYVMKKLEDSEASLSVK